MLSPRDSRGFGAGADLRGGIFACRRIGWFQVHTVARVLSL